MIQAQKGPRCHYRSLGTIHSAGSLQGVFESRLDPALALLLVALDQPRLVSAGKGAMAGPSHGAANQAPGQLPACYHP
eukprot:288202-Chlamydomonas_euryale.AAC.1